MKIINIVIPGIITLILVTIYSVKSQGLSTMLPFGGSFILAYILYLLTSYRRMPEPDRVLPIYLFAVGTQLLHFLEEFTTGFHIRISREIYGGNPYTPNEFVASQMGMFFLAIIGAIAIFRKWKIPMVFVWFVVVMFMFVNMIQHPIFSIIVRGYFPGLITSSVGWVLGPILFIRLWEVRRIN